MKKRFTLSLLAILCFFGTMKAAVIEDGVYSISCIQTDGYVAIGAYHDMAPYICYVTNAQSIASDGYWVVTNTDSGYIFQNEATGQLLVYTTGREDAYYKGMTLASTAPGDNSQFWNVTANEDGSLSMESAIASNYFWNLRVGQGLLGTYYSSSSRSSNERYILTKKGSNPDSGSESEPTMLTAFPKALHVFLTDGRIEAYPLEYVTNQSENAGKFIIETNIGKTFSYNASDVDHVSEEAPTDFPTFDSYKFNNKFNDQLFTDALGEFTADTVNVTIAAIGKRLTPSFKLPDDQVLVYVNGEPQESKVTRLRFDKDIYYVVTRPGITILLPKDDSYTMQPYGRIVRVHVDWLTDRALVPRIDIVTADGQPIDSKEEYKDATITINGHDIFPSMETTDVRIKGRGNSSWSWPKKPYRLKFAQKMKPLGMTSGKNWVLLSNYQRGSLMTNAIGMKAANLIGSSGANHIVPVDLYLNGEYRGSYNLTEKIGFSNNSIDIMDDTAAALLELDSYFDEPPTQKFRSDRYNLPVNIKDPDFTEGTTRLTLDMIRTDFQALLKTLACGQDISTHVDVDKLARFLIVNELVNNYELFHPKSYYIYRESLESDTSKYVFGPVWDLDWAFGYEGTGSYFQADATRNYWSDSRVTTARQFMQELRFRDHAVDAAYREIFQRFMDNSLNELMEYCQDYYDFAHQSFEDNSYLWWDDTNYSQQATTAATWLQQRANQIYSDLQNNIQPTLSEPEDPNKDPEEEEPITPVLFENDKLYTITCKRGAIVLNEDHTGLAAGQIRTDAPEEDGHFAILNIDGKQYIYSPVTKMFLHYSDNGTWVDKLGSPINFTILYPDGDYLYTISTFKDDGSPLYFNNSTRDIVINSWDTPDDGDRWKVEVVADFDPTEAFQLVERDYFDVTLNLLWNNQVIATETKKAPYAATPPQPSNEWSNAFVTIKPRTEVPTAITGNTTIDYDAVWNGPFQFSTDEADAKWYNMTIRTEYYVGKTDTEPYRPIAIDDPITLRLPAYHWAFGGNPYKVIVYNRTTGFSETLSKDSDNAVMRPGKSLWELLPNNDGFILRLPDTLQTCINQLHGAEGALQFWTDAGSLSDDGSTLRVTLAPDLYDGIKQAATTDHSTIIYDTTGRHLQRITRPGIYIVNGQKVVVK